MANLPGNQTFRCSICSRVENGYNNHFVSKTLCWLCCVNYHIANPNVKPEDWRASANLPQTHPVLERNKNEFSSKAITPPEKSSKDKPEFSEISRNLTPRVHKRLFYQTRQELRNKVRKRDIKIEYPFWVSGKSYLVVLFLDAVVGVPIIMINPTTEFTTPILFFYLLLFSLLAWWLICGSVKWRIRQPIEREEKSKIREEESKIYRRLVYERHTKQQETESFLSSVDWKSVRKKVIDTNPHECQWCGKKLNLGSDLTVDHILPRSKYPDLALDKTNLQILCRSCNSSKGAT